MAVTLQAWQGMHVADIYNITAQYGQHVAGACNIKGKKRCYVVHATHKHGGCSGYHHTSLLKTSSESVNCYCPGTGDFTSPTTVAVTTVH